MFRPSRRAAVAAATLALVSWLAPQAHASRGSDPGPGPGPGGNLPGLPDDLPDLLDELPGPGGLPPLDDNLPGAPDDLPGLPPPGDVPGLPGGELPGLPGIGLPEPPDGGSDPLGLDVLLSVSLSGSITLL